MAEPKSASNILWNLLKIVSSFLNSFHTRPTGGRHLPLRSHSFASCFSDVQCHFIWLLNLKVIMWCSGLIMVRIRFMPLSVRSLLLYL